MSKYAQSVRLMTQPNHPQLAAGRAVAVCGRLMDVTWDQVLQLEAAAEAIAELGEITLRVLAGNQVRSGKWLRANRVPAVSETWRLQRLYWSTGGHATCSAGVPVVRTARRFTIAEGGSIGACFWASAAGSCGCTLRSARITCCDM